MDKNYNPNKLEQSGKKRPTSRSNKRFFTSRDMAIIKHDDAKRNAQVKRGEIKRGLVDFIHVCGCGVEGCFIHSSRMPSEFDEPKVVKVKQVPFTDNAAYDLWLKERGIK